MEYQKDYKGHNWGMLGENVPANDDVFGETESRYWDGIARTYQETSQQTLWRVHSDAVNKKLTARWLPNSKVGCLLKTDMFDEAFNDGLYPLLVSKAKKVIGMDMSGSILHAARSRYDGLQSLGADTRCLPFADGSFDAIVSISTLDHFESHHGIVLSLHELYRVLRVGGLMILTLDNPANPVIKLRGAMSFRFLNRVGILPYYVGANYDSRHLGRILRQVGFEILKVDAVMHCPRVFAVAIARMLERHTGQETQKRYLRILMALEHLSCWPTRFLTGHFVAVKAIKR